MSAKTPVIEAHRGGREDAPENTLAAFRSAVGMGVKWIELDVRASKDGALMVFHDEKLERLTDSAGPLAERTLDDLLRLDAGARFGPRFAGERIPTLEQVVDLVAASPVRLNVEIKAPAAPGVAEKVAALLRGAGKAGEYVVSSFGLAELMDVRQAAPEIALALIGKAPEILPVAVDRDIPWIHCNHETLTPALVEQAHGAGLKVNVWTVDEVERLSHWRAAGLDKLCTNRPKAMMMAAG